MQLRTALPFRPGIKVEIKAALEAPRKISAYALKTFGELKDKICRVVTAGAQGAGFFFGTGHVGIKKLAPGPKKAEMKKFNQKCQNKFNSINKNFNSIQFNSIEPKVQFNPTLLRRHQKVFFNTTGDPNQQPPRGGPWKRFI